MIDASVSGDCSVSGPSVVSIRTSPFSANFRCQRRRGIDAPPCRGYPELTRVLRVQPLSHQGSLAHLTAGERVAELGAGEDSEQLVARLALQVAGRVGGQRAARLVEAG